MSALETILDRAASDPDFKSRLTQDPAGTAQAEGLSLSPEELESLQGMGTGTDAIELLQARVSHGRLGATGGERVGSWFYNRTTG